MRRVFWSCGFVLVVGGVAAASFAKSRPVSVHVVHGYVMRSAAPATSSDECVVELQVEGGDSNVDRSIRSIHISRAVDDTGQVLVIVPQDPRAIPAITTVPSGVITLQHPAPQATKIQVLEGELELFSPTPQNHGMVTVRRFLEQPGVALAPEILTSEGVTVKYATKEMADEIVRSESLPTSPSRPTAPNLFHTPDAIDKPSLPSFSLEILGFGDIDAGGQTLRFFIDDPQKKVIRLDLRDEHGAPLKQLSGFLTGDRIHMFALSQSPPANLQLVIYLATPQALTRIPFTLGNIPLSLAREADRKRNSRLQE